MFAIFCIHVVMAPLGLFIANFFVFFIAIPAVFAIMHFKSDKYIINNRCSCGKHLVVSHNLFLQKLNVVYNRF